MKRYKKIVALLLAAILVTTAIGTAVGAVAGRTATADPPRTDLPAVPEVTVEGNRVDSKAEWFELSLRVSGARFQTAGVVLAYDTAVLRPVDWTAGATVDVTGKTWSAATVLPTKGSDGLGGKPALAYVPDHEADAPAYGYLYLGADTLAFTDLDKERVVTVRFTYEDPDNKTVTMPTAEAVAAAEPGTRYTIELAPDTVAAAAIPGMPLLTTVEDSTAVDGSIKAYEYGKDYTVGSGDEAETVTDYAPVFVFKDGPSAGAGGAAGSTGNYAITFFDWDGRVIDAIAAEANATAAVTNWQSQSGIQARLKNKPGYEFECWIVVEQVEEALVSEHQDRTSRKTNGGTAPTDKADFSDLTKYTTDLSKSVLVQAAYKTTTAVNGGNGDGASLVESYSEYKFGTPTFYQYGSVDANNGQYAVRCTVSRNDALRTDQPTVLAKVYVQAGAGLEVVTVKVDLENTDQTSFEVVVPRSTTQITYTVLDTYGLAAWTNGTIRSQEEDAQSGDIIREGALARLADEAYNASRTGVWSTEINAQCIIDAGFPSAATRLEAAKTALANRAAAEGRPLTRAEVVSTLTGV